MTNSRETLEQQSAGKGEAEIIRTFRVRIEEVVKQTLPNILGRVLMKSKTPRATNPKDTGSSTFEKVAACIVERTKADKARNPSIW